MKLQKPFTIALVLVASVIMMGFTGLIVLRLFFFNYNTIPQDGMYPGMPTGSRFITRRHPYQSISEIKRGDVVVFTRETSLNGTHKYIWRVVGLPADLVEVSNEAVKLNGQALKHETVRKEGQYLIVREWNGDVSYEVAYNQALDRSDPPIASMTVPRDHLFLLGDNRYMAEDSTFIGSVPFSSIVEKKIF
ncbi:MAG TPA: signal peptidase I [Pyrinomonadaceae bacterium]|jgi:signal peptidase I|nr:signal peptidase I [Pyrinomonadaceae bacterium]